MAATMPALKDGLHLRYVSIYGKVDCVVVSSSVFVSFSLFSIIQLGKEGKGKILLVDMTSILSTHQ